MKVQSVDGNIVTIDTENDTLVALTEEELGDIYETTRKMVEAPSKQRRQQLAQTIYGIPKMDDAATKKADAASE